MTPKQVRPDHSFNRPTIELERIEREMRLIKKKLLFFSKQNSKFLDQIHPEFRAGGLNFLHYLALRKTDLKDLQLQLAHFGLSSLGRCESHVMGNVEQVLERIGDSLRVRGRKTSIRPPSATESLTWFEAEKNLHQHTRDLFGERPRGRHVYIMVTAPSVLEFSEAWARKILMAGTNLIRVNCAHDNRQGWSEVITKIRTISKELSQPCRIIMDLGGPKIRTSILKSKKLSVGDRFDLVGGIRKEKREVHCSIAEVLRFVKVGERVLFDDGKIETRVVEVVNRRTQLEVTRVPAPNTKLKNEKGINFPDSHIKISEITAQDLEDLDFVAEHADLIGLSFMQSPEAIRKIRRELKKRTMRKPGLVLKIETQKGFQELPKLLLEVMKDYPCGVMIARGDLGVEVGFDRMVEIQEEILWLCEAAHVPVIWATQVLENEAKVGLPSRAEVTDAAMAVKAECVMLNKGPFIDSAVRSLDSILRRMEYHTYKKRNLNRALRVAIAFQS